MYKSKNHSKYSLKVHLVFVVKYRKSIISNDVSDCLKHIINKIAAKSNFYVELMDTAKNHIHLLVDYEPKISVLQIVRRLKQETIYALWKEFPDTLSNVFLEKLHFLVQWLFCLQYRRRSQL